ncbi:MAG TPA: TlpA disulfide reductase family protein [Thermomicrobiaceae bacterium]|nr:TlpA disulfide reductase family protein [Thermomicrobiaceae bacterium]
MRNRVIPGVTIVIVAALLGLLGYALFAPKPQTSALGAGGRIEQGSSVETFTNRKAPGFSIKSFSGQDLSLSQFRGKTVVVNFWASWCQPCQQEAPVLSAISQNLPANTVLVGIDVWDTSSDATSFLAQNDAHYLVGPDNDGSIAINYGVAGVPETFFISPTGMLLGKYIGPLTSPDQFATVLKKFQAGG